jgi:hypothetical protein
MSSLTRPLLTEGAAAIAAAVGFCTVAVFQIALAAGAPLGRAAWGGTHPGQLPLGLRVGSAIAVAAWVLAALIVLGRAGVTPTPLPPTFLQWGTWSLVGVTLIGALMNLASPSPWERYMWAPITLVLAGLCFLVARTTPTPAG